MVVAPVRLSDPGVVTMLRSGDLVDILAANPPAGGGLDDSFVMGAGSGATGSASVVAAGIRVITILSAVTESGGVLGGAAPSPSGGDGALVLIAASPETAQRLAAAAVTSSLSVIVRAG
jgi:pilus assembly protein CpaB